MGDRFRRLSTGLGNAIQIYFKDGSSTERVQIDYPIGHRRRRDEGIPVLVRKFEDAVRGHFGADQAERIIAACADREALEATPINVFMDLWAAT